MTGQPAAGLRLDFAAVYFKLHSDQDREHPARGYKGKRAAATRQYMEYGEEPHSAADKGIGWKAT